MCFRALKTFVYAFVIEQMADIIYSRPSEYSQYKYENAYTSGLNTTPSFCGYSVPVREESLIKTRRIPNDTIVRP